MSSLSSRQLDSLLRKIYGVRSPTENRLAWLYQQARHESGAVRCAAISRLSEVAAPAALRPLFLELLDTEADQDVLIPVFSALSIGALGSRDKRLVTRFRTAIARFEHVYSGTRASFEDALLRIVEGLESRAIARLDPNERRRLLEQININGSVN
jgi:hypothetical protein